MPVFAVSYGLAEAPGREDRAARLKAAAWKLSPERPLYDAVDGLLLVETAGTSQTLMESLTQAAQMGPADWMAAFNLTYPEHAAFGLPAPERLSYVMWLREASLRA